MLVLVGRIRCETSEIILSNLGWTLNIFIALFNVNVICFQDDESNSNIYIE